MLVLVVTLILTVNAQTNNSPQFDYDKSDDELFEQYKEVYNKHYKDLEEENKRKKIISDRLRIIREKRLQGKINYELNVYSDRTKYEIPHSNVNFTLEQLQEIKKNFKTLRYNKGMIEDVPDNYFSCDPNGDNLCGEPIDQGKCGSCYACSVANAAQIHYAQLTKEKGSMKKEVFSPQQLMDCLTHSPDTGYIKQGCNGGRIEHVLSSVESFELNSSYPYEDGTEWCMETKEEINKNGQCTYICQELDEERCEMAQQFLSIANLHKCKETGKSRPLSHDINQAYTFYECEWELIKYFIYKHKAILASIEMPEVTIQNLEGIFECDKEPSEIHLDHAVVIDGYGVEKVNGQDVNYLWIRNSHGKMFGKYQEHFKLNFNKSCGVNAKSNVQGTVQPVPSIVMATYLTKVSCEYGCDVCETSNVCSKCYNGFYLEGGVCKPCMNYCNKCTTSDTCDECDDMHNYNNEEKKCVLNSVTGVTILLSILAFLML